MSDCDRQKNNKKQTDDASTVDRWMMHPIGDGMMITTVAATAAVIFFGLRLVGMGQGNALLTSTSLVWFISLPVWEM